MTTPPLSMAAVVDRERLRRITGELLGGNDVSEDDARGLLVALADPDVADAVKGAVLGAMRVKGETAAEVRGLALAMRDLASPLPGPVRDDLVDTCGTGGDGSHSVNVSTATALLAAGCGLRVAKHGNRSVSSRSGSADVLKALGLAIPESPQQAATQLDACGFTFLFAPLFHGAMKGVAPVRQAIGARTVFNILGPLTNPARPRYQLVGAYAPDVARLMAQALAGIPGSRATVVHGAPAWDEATPCGPFLKLDVRDGVVGETEVDPAGELGLDHATPEDLAGGDPAENARRLEAVLAGEEGGAHRDAVLLNTALVLDVAGRCRDLRDGLDQARAALEAGAGLRVLEQLRQPIAAEDPQAEEGAA